MGGIINSFQNFLLVTALLPGCIQAQDQATSIEGTWVGCDEDGTYIEFHFSKYESMYVYSDIIDLAYPVPYSIRKNEIHYTNTLLDLTDVDTFLIERNTVILKNNYHTLKLNKQSDFPIVPLESRKSNHNVSFSDSALYRHYRRMFLIREAEHECKSN